MCAVHSMCTQPVEGQAEANTRTEIEAAALPFDPVITDTQQGLILRRRAIGARYGAGGLIALGDELVGIETTDVRMQPVVDLRQRKIHVESGLGTQAVIHGVQERGRDTAVHLSVDSFILDGTEPAVHMLGRAPQCVVHGLVRLIQPMKRDVLI